MTIFSKSDKLVITLIVNGFHLEDFTRISKDHSIVSLKKYDGFGAKILYAVLISKKKPSSAIIERLKKIASSKKYSPFIICVEELNLTYDSYTFDEFYKKIGGVVNTGLVLNPELKGIMKSLGHNKLPLGLDGRPEDLLEIYSKECFQFLFKTPVRRYGIDRSFESVPDGIILCNNTTAYLFDSKAYEGGFKFKSDDINRFERYVEDFNSKYSHILKIKSFIVISGDFKDSESSLSNRSMELMSRTQVPISCVSSETLAEMVRIIVDNPKYQQSINWSRILVKPLVKLASLNKQIENLEKDKII